jgi:light-regulated signal transduction histidine kinase (bacteriophytochrome)
MGESDYLPGKTPSADASDTEASFMFNVFYDQPGMSVIVRASDLNVRFVNRNFETAFGYLNNNVQVSELVITDLLEREQIPALMQRLQLGAENSDCGTFSFKGANGTAVRYTLFAATISHNSKADYLHLLLMPEVKGEHLPNKEVEEFAYIASHDLQEPLRKITAFSEKLTNKYKDVIAGDGALYLSRMEAAANNMRQLIDGLLEFSRVGRGGQHFEPVALDNILSQVVMDLEAGIEEAGIEITGKPLPEIRAAASLIKQLFTNIVGNAIKFRNKEGAAKLEVFAEVPDASELLKHGLDAGREYTKIVFRDNGIGFEDEYATRIFQVFQRLHGKSEYPGSGIGLAICKKIMDYHKGVIFATGRIGEGSSFTVLIPVNRIK